MKEATTSLNHTFETESGRELELQQKKREWWEANLAKAWGIELASLYNQQKEQISKSNETSFLTK